MNKHLSLLLFLTCTVAFYLTACAKGESVVSSAFYETTPRTIGIVDVVGDIEGTVPKNQVSDFFAMELLRKGYHVIERDRVKSLLKEQEFQRSPVTSSDEVAKIGQVLNISTVAFIDVDVSGEKVSLTSRLVRAETGNVLWIGSGRAGSGDLVGTVAGTLAGIGIGVQVGDGTGQTASAIGGGVLGGTAGNALTPQAARVVQMAIQEMVQDLPHRDSITGGL